MAQFYSPNRRVTTRQTITVTVNSLDPFGQGVAREKGKAIFIPEVLPGEQAEIELIEQKCQYSRGKLKHLLNQCSERVTPPCPHFGICGGCQQQHACSQLQQDSKADSLRRLLVNATGACPVLGPVICGPEYGYRRRARLGLLYQPKQQRLQMGFHQTESHDLLSVKHCPVLRPELERLL